MTNLYLAPVGDEWIKRFNNTVAEPVELPEASPLRELHAEDQVRVWGTTRGNTENGANKLKHFREMSSDDLVLFYRSGRYFASGRVNKTVEHEQLGDTLWNSTDSSLIYTLSEFEEIDVPASQVAKTLGYSESYYPNGFMKAADSTLTKLLQKYNSVEEAYQDLKRKDGDDEPEEHERIPKPKTESSEQRIHTEIQWLLIKLGIEHGYEVYVAKNDKNAMHEGEKLGEKCIDKLSLAGFSDATISIIEYVDVIWLRGDYIVKMFEVESTTSVFSGILRMTDFAVKVPNLAVDMYIVAPDADEDKVRREMNRPTFRAVLEQADHCSLQYLSFEQVQSRYSQVKEVGPLQYLF